MALDIVHAYPFVFYEQVFNCYLASDRQWYIPLIDLCESLDISTDSQRKRIQGDEAVAEYLVNIPLETPYRDTTRVRDVACLNVRRLPYWLGTIDARRVSEEKRPRVILFKREFADAAWDVFRTDIMPSEILSEMDVYETPEQQHYSEIMDEAASLRRRVTDLGGDFSKAVIAIGEQMGDFSGRLGKLEARFEGVEFINAAQAKNIQTMINALAMARSELEKSKSKGKIFFECWQDLKTRFELPVYTMLPAAEYEAAVEHLKKRWRHYFPDREFPGSFLRAGQKRML